jgi:hypothetical protein
MHSPHVVVNKQTWHYRLFWWSLDVIDTWRGGRSGYAKKYEYGTTLFHYLGIICFWMPLAVGSSIACYIGMFLFLVLYPIEIKGLVEYIGFLAVLCGTFMVFQMLRFAVVKMSYGAQARKTHTPGALVLARKYISAKVEGSKPLITFVGNKKK